MREEQPNNSSEACVRVTTAGKGDAGGHGGLHNAGPREESGWHAVGNVTPLQTKWGNDAIRSVLKITWVDALRRARKHHGDQFGS